MLAALDSPGPLTMQPITARVMVFDAFVLRFPGGHHFADVVLDAFGEFLKSGAGGAAAAGAGRDAWRKRAQAERLKQFARGVNFFAAIAAGARRERNADGVADAVVEQDAQRCGGPDQSFGAHSGFGQAEVQRLFGLAGEIAIDGDEIARTRSLAGNDDLIVAQAGFERKFGRLHRGEDHALVDDLFGFEPRFLSVFSCILA